MPEFNEYRYSALEYREEAAESEDFLGVTLGGPVLNYGDIAQLPWGKERFEPGAFGDISKLTVRANRMHQREMPLGVTGENLVYTDTAKALSAEIKLLNTTAGRDTAVDVRQKVLAGQSVEFRTNNDRVQDGTRIISGARFFGHGVVDVPAYPQSTVGQRAEMRSWDEYFQAMEYRNGIFAAPEKPAETRQGSFDIAKWWAEHRAAGDSHFVLDPLGRQIVLSDMSMELMDNEERQIARLTIEGRLPYNSDGIISMARNEHVLILPGAFTASLGGEIVLLSGNNYDHTLASTAAKTLTHQDGDDALRIRAKNLPDTTFARDFEQSLSRGLIRGLTVGWALQGSKTSSEDIEGGGTRITVEEAMLCEWRGRSRSAFPGEQIKPRTRRMESRLWLV